MKLIFRSWYPLALSWLFMATELPLINCAISRLPEPKIQLAAFGGIAFAIAWFIESPIIMLLSASTALSRDLASYRVGYRVMMRICLFLTLIHLAVTFTPLFHLLLAHVVEAPTELHESVRLALICLVPWTWAIGYRRFHQGLLIRFGESRYVTQGTMIRISALVGVLLFGLTTRLLPAASLAALAASIGVVAEALFIGYRARITVEAKVAHAPVQNPPLNNREFWFFYLPLALTALIDYLEPPIGSATMSRMPFSIMSLAAWPVIASTNFLFKCSGIALKEVVISLVEYRRHHKELQRFTLMVGIVTALAALIFAATDLSTLMFSRVFALPPDLITFLKPYLLLTAPIPLLSALRSWYQGVLIHFRDTKRVTQGVIVYTIVYIALMLSGVYFTSLPGLALALTGTALSCCAEVCYLAYRVRASGVLFNSNVDSEHSTHGMERRSHIGNDIEL